MIKMDKKFWIGMVLYFIFATIFIFLLRNVGLFNENRWEVTAIALSPYIFYKIGTLSN
jgi:hypothetical protein